MKRKKKNKMYPLLFIIILVIISIILYITNIEKIKEQNVWLKLRYGNPISEDGTINNNYFGIKMDGTDPQGTLQGINEAINYASKNNISNIKLEKGTYVIDSQKDKVEYHYQEKGITLKSNIKLDLNGSTIKHIKNNRVSYTLISIIDIENAAITNGILEGDRNEHEYIENQTHEFGHGIDLAGGKNIEISNLEIKEMTGDGIYITCKQVYDIPQYSINIKIHDCNIYNCRRQGISIIVANNVEIYHNEIHNIKGTNPQTCIDLETGNKEYRIEKINIHNNKFYSAESQIAIQVSKNVIDISACENEITGQVRIYNAEKEANISNNIVVNGAIKGVLNSYNLYDENYYVNKLKIKQNQLYNSAIELSRLSDSIIEENKIRNGYISVESMNAMIRNNSIENEKEEIQEYAYCYKFSKEDENNYTIYKSGNTVKGLFTYTEANNLGDKIEICDDIDRINQYQDFFEQK